MSTPVDACGHGIDMDDVCLECDGIIDAAVKDGALTPREIGLWEKGYNAGFKDGAR